MYINPYGFALLLILWTIIVGWIFYQEGKESQKIEDEEKRLSDTEYDMKAWDNYGK